MHINSSKLSPCHAYFYFKTKSLSCHVMCTFYSTSKLSSYHAHISSSNWVHVICISNSKLSPRHPYYFFKTKTSTLKLSLRDEYFNFETKSMSCIFSNLIGQSLPTQPSCWLAQIFSSFTFLNTWMGVPTPSLWHV